MKKICIKCKIEKELSLFYEHKKMKDGFLNKCIECCKLQSNEREKKLRENPEWIEKERERNRNRYYKSGGYKKADPVLKKIAISKYKGKYPEKQRARNLSNHLFALVKGNHLHHWNYNVGFEKDVIELPAKNHFTIHRFLIYDQERMMYRRNDNLVLLDTKESHLEFIEQIINGF